MTKDLPNPPAYFPLNVKLNQKGYLDFDKVLNNSLSPLNLNEFKNLMDKNNTIVLDVRNENEFRKGFIPTSIFIGLNGSFAPWVGTIVEDIETKILLICENKKEEETILRLSRVGFDNCIGFLDGGFDTWKFSGNTIGIIDSISAIELKEVIGSVNLLDVRKVGERNNGYLEQSFNIPLDSLKESLSKINKKDKYFIHCAGGYRSMIAASLLKRNGCESIVDVKGGFDSIRKVDFNILEKACIN